MEIIKGQNERATPLLQGLLEVSMEHVLSNQGDIQQAFRLFEHLLEILPHGSCSPVTAKKPGENLSSFELAECIERLPSKLSQLIVTMKVAWHSFSEDDKKHLEDFALTILKVEADSSFRKTLGLRLRLFLPSLCYRRANLALILPAMRCRYRFVRHVHCWCVYHQTTGMECSRR